MQLRISKGGQISLPASIRRRWGVGSILVEDLGDRVVLRPIPDDPIDAAMGALSSKNMTSDQARARTRREEQASEASKHRR